MLGGKRVTTKVSPLRSIPIEVEKLVFQGHLVFCQTPVGAAPGHEWNFPPAGSGGGEIWTEWVKDLIHLWFPKEEKTHLPFEIDCQGELPVQTGGLKKFPGVKVK